MTLLSICIAVADEVGIERPTSIVGNAQPTSQKLLRYANKTGTRLMKKVAWEVLRKEKTFTSVATETQTGILPSDFDRFVTETFWDRTYATLMPGPISASEWPGLKAFNYAGEAKFALRGGSVLVIPVPASGRSYAFEYVSNTWCQSAALAAQTAFAADTDTGILDEELLTLGTKFVYLTDEGLPNQIAAAEFKEYFDMVLDNDQPNARIMVAGDIFGIAGSGRHYTGTPPSGATNINFL